MWLLSPAGEAGQVFAITLPSSDASLQGKTAGKRWLTNNSKCSSQVLKGGSRIKLNSIKQKEWLKAHAVVALNHLRER